MMESQEMKIKILNVIKQKDGSGIVDIEVTNELRIFVRNYYKRIRCTNKLISKFVQEGIKNYLRKNKLCKN